MYINSDYGGTTTSDLTVMQEMIDNLEPLLWKYRVNIGFYGHNHVVQRHSAVLNYTVIQESVPEEDNEGNIVHVHRDPQVNHLKSSLLYSVIQSAISSSLIIKYHY